MAKVNPRDSRNPRGKIIIIFNALRRAWFAGESYCVLISPSPWAIHVTLKMLASSCHQSCLSDHAYSIHSQSQSHFIPSIPLYPCTLQTFPVMNDQATRPLGRLQGTAKLWGITGITINMIEPHGSDDSKKTPTFSF